MNFTVLYRCEHTFVAWVGLGRARTDVFSLCAPDISKVLQLLLPHLGGLPAETPCKVWLRVQ
jgi:hypothetical protein